MSVCLARYKKQKKKTETQRPNAFISLRITNEQVSQGSVSISSYSNIEQSDTSRDPSCRSDHRSGSSNSRRNHWTHSSLIESKCIYSHTSHNTDGLCIKHGRWQTKVSVRWVPYASCLFRELKIYPMRFSDDFFFFVTVHCWLTLFIWSLIKK